jgi:hypothetical protein
MGMDGARLRRLTGLAVLDWAILQGLAVLAAGIGLRPGVQPFVYLFAIGMVAKALGDLLYYMAMPDRKRWRYLDDYLINELLLQARFVLPAATAQGWLALFVPVYLPDAWPLLRFVIVSPVVGVILWLVNRSLVEEADDQSSRPLGTRAARLSAPVDGEAKSPDANRQPPSAPRP